jgi:hypothetical protein
MSAFATRKHLLVLLAAILLALPVSAATVVIDNQDGPGEGFNDTTPVSPVGGNPGTTLGAQRLNAFQFAADVWGAFLDSNVTIRIGANFDPLSCGPTSGVLGGAGTTTVHRDFTNAPVSGTWYPQALANSLAGSDLDPSNPDVGATFNSDIDDDDPNCLTGITWYLGLDGNAGNDIDFVDVVMHEIGHGIGFATYVDESNGTRFLNRDDIYMTFLEDHSTGKVWDNMNNNQRKNSAKDTGDLHWVGANVVGASGPLTGGVHSSGHVQAYAPNPIQPGSSVSHWDTAVTPNELMEPFISPVPIQDPGLARELMLDIGWNGGGNEPVCGNGVREGTEECDDPDYGGLDCTDFGFTGGTLTCSGSCTIGTGSCNNDPPICEPIGNSCNKDSDCCSLNCSNGPPSTRVCQ